MVFLYRFLLIAFLLAGFCSQARAQLVVLEVFTQDSCAIANELEVSLGTFKKSEIYNSNDVIMFRCHVSENATSDDACFQRFGHYKQTLPKSVYGAPAITKYGIIANGVYTVLGFQKSHIENMVKMVRSIQNPLPIIGDLEDGVLHIEVPEISGHDQMSLDILGVRHKGKALKIDMEDYAEKPGEINDVVVSHKPVEKWNGYAVKTSLPVMDMQADYFVIIAQDQVSGEILAVGRAGDFAQ